MKTFCHEQLPKVLLRSRFESFTKKRKRGTGSRDILNVWIENKNRDEEPVVDFIRLFSVKTATSQNGTELVLYPVHIIFLIVCAREMPWLTGNGYMLIGS